MYLQRDFTQDVNFIPFDKRKKILLLSDDLRMPSGVGTMSKEIVLNTLHHFHWVQVGGAIKHPEKGKIIDMTQEMERILGIKNYMRIYPTDGYGEPDMIRWLLDTEKPDAILHFTDPRFWIWLYQMEHEIRQRVPIIFYTIWDDLPFPKYNQPYYESCDALFCISKQTYNICKHVLLPENVISIRFDNLPSGEGFKNDTVFKEFDESVGKGEIVGEQPVE